MMARALFSCLVHARRTAMALCAALVLFLPAVAAQASSDIPLVVIRYNQERIYYDRQLYSAVSKAVAIKPSVMFSVVSFVPENGSDRRQEMMAAQAQQQTAKLVSDLRQMGVPPQQIRVSREMVPDGAYHELYIYVD